jgi:S1-C subfamily serine protease
LGVNGQGHRDGVLITLVADDSGAQRAEIQVGDILTEVEGRPVKSIKEMVMILYTRKAGDVVRVTLIRDNAKIDKNVSLGARSSGAEKALPPTTQSSD